MSDSDPLLQNFQTSLNAHVKNVRDELTNLISSIHLARAQPNNNFFEQVARTQPAISDFQKFFGHQNQSPFLMRLRDTVTKLETNPNDFRLIRDLIEADPQVINLAGGPNAGNILEDQIKNLVTDQQLQEELGDLDSRLREFIEQKGNEISFNMMREITRLAELIRQSKNRSILETICKTDTAYLTLAAIADAVGQTSGIFTAITALGVLAAKVNGTARSKLNEKMEEYEDSLAIKIADLKLNLPSDRSILSLPDAGSREI